MDIRPVDRIMPVVENTVHDDRERPQKRHPQRKKEKASPNPVYKPNGELEEAPPPKIDVLV